MSDRQNRHDCGSFYCTHCSICAEYIGCAEEHEAEGCSCAPRKEEDEEITGYPV